MERLTSAPRAEHLGRFFGRISMLGLIATAAAFAEEPAGCESTVLTLAEAAELLRIDLNEMSRLAERSEVPGRRVGENWRFACDALLDWLDGTKEANPDVTARATARSSSTAPMGPPLSARGLANVTATGTAQAQVESLTQDSRPADDVGDEPIGEAPEERTAEDIFLRSQRVLLGPGQAVLDFGLSYTEFNGQPLASIDASPVLTTVEQENFLTTLQARIGFRNETEIFVSTAYFSQDNEAFLGNRKIASSSTSDFGSVNFGVRHAFKLEGQGRPDIIGSITTRIPTDDTAYALGGGLSFVKSVDPVVLFASIGYTHVFARNRSDLMALQPKDRVDVAFGYALGLNDTIALSMSISGTFTAAEQFEDASLRQRDSYAVRFGLTSWLARGVYIEPSVSFNLGGPDDGFAFGVTVPYTLGRNSM